MRIILLIHLFICPVLGCAQQSTLQSLIVKIQDAVFTVYAELDDGLSQGSGFFISSDGIGITNYHVLDGANKAKIELRNGEQYIIAKILDYDPDTDLVKFKIDNGSREFKSLAIKKNSIQKGEPILNLSSPIGLEQTLSTGIVSSLRRDDTHGAIIQITAPISHGSSGSPVLDMKGEVIGVATFGFEEGQSLNFAVSALQINQLQKNLNISISQMWQNPLETFNVKSARKYMLQGEYQKAHDCLVSEISINPQNHLALYTYSLLLTSTIGFAKDHLATARDAMNASYQASVLKPDCSEYYSQTGLSLVHFGIATLWEGEDGRNAFKLGKTSFELSLQLDSLNVTALYGMAKMLCESSRVSSKIGFSPEERKSNYQIAIKLLSFLELFSPHEYCYYYLTIANQQLGNIGNALLYCDKIIAFNPEWYGGYFLKGDIKIFDMDMFNEGLLDLEKALALCNDPTAKADIYSLRGFACEEKAFKERKDMGKLVVKAVEDYQKAYDLTQNPEYEELLEKLIQRFNKGRVGERNLFR